MDIGLQADSVLMYLLGRRSVTLQRGYESAYKVHRQLSFSKSHCSETCTNIKYLREICKKTKKRYIISDIADFMAVLKIFFKSGKEIGIGQSCFTLKFFLYFQLGSMHTCASVKRSARLETSGKRTK